MLSNITHFVISDDSQMLTDETDRKLHLLLVLCRIILVLEVIGELFLIGVNIVRFNIHASPFPLFLFILVTLVSYRLASKGRYQAASWLLVIASLCQLAPSNFQFGLNLPLTILSMFPVALAAVLLGPRPTVVVTLISVSMNIGPLILQEVLKVYAPVPVERPMVLVASIFLPVIIIPCLVALMVYPTRQQALALKQQNQKLVEALRELETRHITNQEVSQQVVRLSAELRVTANQQASGSQEQAASLTQVNSSITELSSTAVQIAELAQQVSGFTEAMARGSHQIEETTQLSATQSQQGINAIQRTLRVSQEVAELYHQLQATLYDLNTKSSSMRQILILLNSVTAETHLLALNAAIEAASAGQYGERFKVVAHEVKQLANRSQQASQQVVDIIREMEKATLYSVTSVETGYQKAQEMEQVAGEAGFVIKEMRQVSVQAQEQANTISLLANEVQKLGELIRLTTTQQRSASQQVLGAVSEVSIVARQNAEGSVNISSTVEYLEEMSGSLALDLAA